MSEEQNEPISIDISELLQLVLSLQAEVGVVSDLVLDVMKTGELNQAELVRALRIIGEMSIEALEYLAEDEEDPSSSDGESSNNVH